jgi:hypothetical protein
MKRFTWILVILSIAAVTFAQVRSVQRYTAYDLASACPTFVYDDTGGTTAEIGWITVSNEPNRAIQVDIVALTATDAQFMVEARLSGIVTGARIWPSEVGVRTVLGTEDPLSFIIPVPDHVNQVRLGMCITTDTAGAEDIDVVLNTYAPDSR